MWHPGSEEIARKHIPGIVKLLNLDKPVKMIYISIIMIDNKIKMIEGENNDNEC